MGPLFGVTAQKLRGGRLEERCELELELAEADVEGLQLTGSLLVQAGAHAAGLGFWLFLIPDSWFLVLTPRCPAQAAQPLGRLQGGGDGEGKLVYDDAACGRLRLRGVTVRNAGIDYGAPGNVYWQARAHRCGV